MKKSKIIIPALAMLVMSTAATVSGTVAWFTMNKIANANGMVVGAKTSGSLIIKEAGTSLPQTTDKATKITFANTAHQFYPSTHDWTVGNESGLKVVTNGQDVNFETGTRMNDDTDLSFTGVSLATAGQTSDYYFDYGLFIAGDGIAMNGQDITLTFRGANDTAFTALTNINGALSVDFYGGAASSAAMLAPTSSNFISTLNLAHRRNGSANPVTSVTIPNVNIPVSGSGSAYAITMRVYFDGALIDQDVPGNDFAEYVTAGSGTRQSGENFLYYSDDQGSAIVNVDVGGSVAGLYKVDTNASTLCFARSINVLSLENQTINVHIEAGDHHD